MKHRKEIHHEESKYLKLYYLLREEIVNGIYPPGAKLPSKRMLAAEMEMSIITVEHALALLVDEGYAEARARSGIYSSFGGSGTSLGISRRAELHEMQTTGTPPEDFPFSVLARTMRGVLSEYDRQILVKAPNSGCKELQIAIAAYLARSRALKITPEQIIIGSGAEYLYGLVVQLLGRDRLFALEDPCYEKIRRVYDLNGAVCRLLPMGEDGIKSESLEACAAGALHVTPFHSYPSGVTASAAKRHEYVSWAEKNRAYVIEDDYDSELATRKKQVETICSLSPGRVIYLNTFSKVLAPSMRIGFMVLPEALLDQYRQKLGFMSCPVPVFEQLVLASFLNEGHLERYINRKKRMSFTAGRS